MDILDLSGFTANIKKFFSDWFGGYWARILGMWNGSMAWLVTVWGVVLLVAGWLWSVWHFISGSLHSAIAYVDAIIIPTVGAPSGWLLGKFALANTFFPVDELFQMILAYLTLLGVLFTLKLGRKAAGWLFGL